MKRIITLFLIVYSSNLYSQNIGIGTSNPISKLSVGPESELQVDSIGNIKKIRGINYSFPSAQGANGTVLTNDGTGELTWASGAGAGWNITGNAGTNSAIHFVGTIDSSNLMFRVNNFPSGFINPGLLSVGFGTRVSSNGLRNASLGYQSFQNNSSGNDHSCWLSFIKVK